MTVCYISIFEMLPEHLWSSLPHFVRNAILGPACSGVSWTFVLVLTGPGTFVEQVHLGVAKGSRIPYIGRRLYLVKPQREAGLWLCSFSFGK